MIHLEKVLFCHHLVFKLFQNLAAEINIVYTSNPKNEMEMPASIITQVSRESESTVNGYHSQSIDDKSMTASIRAKKKKNGGHTTFHSLLCCIGRPRKKTNLNNTTNITEIWPSSQERDKINNTGTGSTSLSPSGGTTINSNPDDNLIAAALPEGLPNTNGDTKRFLLPPLNANNCSKKCAVIDLDETLVHSSFKPISNADFIVPVEIDGTTHEVYVLKRPHVDTYLERMGEMYECVLFTASLAKYADPVADLLDKSGVFTWRLFRESCVFHHGNYVKDLNLIGRDLNKVIIIDNSPASYSFHPNNAVPVISWFDDPSDTELLDILPFLEAIAESDDVYSVLRTHGFTSHAIESTAYLRHSHQLDHDADASTQER